MTSLLNNVSTILTASGSDNESALLGARWGFGLPSESAWEHLTEYSWPLSMPAFPQLLHERTGLVLNEHLLPVRTHLYDYLARGQKAVVAVDSYWLPYRPAFGRVHSHRTIIVRAATDQGELFIDDNWLPAYRGRLLTEDLERARDSIVPIDINREPIFAGVPVRGEWYSVERTPGDFSILDKSGLLGSLINDWRDQADANGVKYGWWALEGFLRELEGLFADRSRTRHLRLRALTLVLRAELSARWFFSALIPLVLPRALPNLSYILIEYRRGLLNGAMARDVMIKSLRTGDNRYADFIIKQATDWIRAESHLRHYLSEILCTQGV